MRRIGDIRTKKVIHPHLLDGDDPFIYAWSLEQTPESVGDLVQAVDHLYQFGRGIDPGWGVAEFLDDDALEERLSRHRGTLHHPSHEGGTHALACPTTGSLSSLLRRYAAGSERLRAAGGGKQLFTQPPKPRFVQVSYDTMSSRRVYELQQIGRETYFQAWPITRVVALVERVRDGIAARLRAAVPELGSAIEYSLIGRKADGADQGRVERRVRIVPLPSIGHAYADRAIRRVAVETPYDGGLMPCDVHWASSSLETTDPLTGEFDGFVLVPTTEEKMLRHYLGGARLWRTVTAAALPEAAKRRRIEPARQRQEAKGAVERGAEEERAIAAVRTALRHSGVTQRAARIAVQREPFEAKGSRAESFAAGTRFAKERLWHVELEFSEPIDGPLLLGNGRFLGLGLLAPAAPSGAALCFMIEKGLADHVDPVDLARALRRAVMARVHGELRPSMKVLPPFFSGHREDGAAARAEESAHLAFQLDFSGRLLVFAPHLFERREPSPEETRHLAVLDRALDGLVELRAGRSGRLLLRRTPINMETDPVLRVSCDWVSETPYVVNRHQKRARDPHDVIKLDLVEECRRRGLPAPSVTVDSARGVAGRGLEGSVRLQFPTAIRGPLLLGRTRYLGGGLFVASGRD
jgi:CRISPR-associated protein Csb2